MGSNEGIGSPNSNLALGTVGFSCGIHYWEVPIDHGEFGSVFLGVCETHVEGQPTLNLNRWQSWGFVSFRATYHISTERIYSDHFNAGVTIGVCLNTEACMYLIAIVYSPIVYTFCFYDGVCLCFLQMYGRNICVENRIDSL
jgi:hypothetical protein